MVIDNYTKKTYLLLSILIILIIIFSVGFLGGETSEITGKVSEIKETAPYNVYMDKPQRVDPTTGACCVPAGYAPTANAAVLSVTPSGAFVWLATLTPPMITQTAGGAWFTTLGGTFLPPPHLALPTVAHTLGSAWVSGGFFFWTHSTGSNWFKHIGATTGPITSIVTTVTAPQGFLFHTAGSNWFTKSGLTAIHITLPTMTGITASDWVIPPTNSKFFTPPTINAIQTTGGLWSLGGGTLLFHVTTSSMGAGSTFFTFPTGAQTFAPTTGLTWQVTNGVTLAACNSAGGDLYFNITAPANTQVFCNSLGYCGDTVCDAPNETNGNCATDCSAPSCTDSDLDGFNTTTGGGCGLMADCNDSNSTVWQNLTVYGDVDLDIYGNNTNTTILCTNGTAPTGWTINNTDCNDGNASINPGASEICDGVDNDCAGGADDTFTAEACQFVCELSYDWAGNGGALNCCGNDPGEATPYEAGTELTCSDGNDNDCDGGSDASDIDCFNCGDSIIDTLEDCDDGINNGVVCSPAYGTNCTYCDGSCDNATVEGSYCGDLSADIPDEECDGFDLNSETCITQGFDAGTLNCTASCTFNTSNCSTTTTETVTISTGGGSTGGTFSQTVNGKLVEGESKVIENLKLGQSVDITINGQSHTMRVQSITGDTITLEFRSDPQVFVLKIGESVEVDLDQDGINDYKVTVLDIVDGEADLDVEKLAQPEVVEVTEEDIIEQIPVEEPTVVGFVLPALPLIVLPMQLIFDSLPIYSLLIFTLLVAAALIKGGVNLPKKTGAKRSLARRTKKFFGSESKKRRAKLKPRAFSIGKGEKIDLDVDADGRVDYKVALRQVKRGVAELKIEKVKSKKKLFLVLILTVLLAYGFLAL